MKKIITMIMAGLSAFAVSAQQTLVATLSKSTGEITQYYGGSGFKSAYEAAEAGDAIYLSPGAFVSCDIVKPLTIRGAGMGEVKPSVTSSGSMTTLINDFTINIAQESQEKLKMEGILTSGTININNLTNADFLRCTFAGKINETGTNTIQNCSFVNCYLKQSYLQGDGNGINFINSWIYCSHHSPHDKYFLYDNCYIDLSSNSNVQEYYLKGSTLNNCIIKCSSAGTSYKIKAAYLTNCLLDLGTRFDDNTVIDHIYRLDSYNSLFKENTFYELTDENAELYIGTDGSQIGIYGGIYPFDVTPTNPQIVKLETPSQSTSSGTLPVTITVK